MVHHVGRFVSCTMLKHGFGRIFWIAAPCLTTRDQRGTDNRSPETVGQRPLDSGRYSKCIVFPESALISIEIVAGGCHVGQHSS
jgi:hypothetical protein